MEKKLSKLPKKDAENIRRERLNERYVRVYQLQPPEWKERVLEFEKEFLEFVEQNKDFEGSYYIKMINDLGFIRVKSYSPLDFSVVNIPMYELTQMKWDSLQEVRRRRAYAEDKELERLDKIAETL